MKKHLKIVQDIPVSIERQSTTDILVYINGYPIVIQTHKLDTLFTLIERCLLESRQGTLLP